VFAATPPSPGAPDFPALCSGALAFAWALAGYRVGKSIESIEERVVVGGLVGFGLGSAVYLVGLVSGLY
jgi:hypothetical protein